MARVNENTAFPASHGARAFGLGVGVLIIATIFALWSIISMPVGRGERVFGSVISADFLGSKGGRLFAQVGADRIWVVGAPAVSALCRPGGSDRAHAVADENSRVLYLRGQRLRDRSLVRMGG